MVDSLMVPTLGSQEGAFENVKANFSGEQVKAPRKATPTAVLRSLTFWPYVTVFYQFVNAILFQGQTIRQLINSRVVRRVAMCCLSASAGNWFVCNFKNSAGHRDVRVEL